MRLIASDDKYDLSSGLMREEKQRLHYVIHNPVGTLY
jgi:hypothetical protein